MGSMEAWWCAHAHGMTSPSVDWWSAWDALVHGIRPPKVHILVHILGHEEFVKMKHYTPVMTNSTVAAETRVNSFPAGPLASGLEA